MVVSFGFTTLQIWLARTWVEEDLEERAVAFAREIAATIGERRELESGRLLGQQIQQILAVRRSAQQLDILVLRPDESVVVATSHPATRLPFGRPDIEQIRRGRVVSRLIEDAGGRAWEVLAPITLEGQVAGAVAARFSLERAAALTARIRTSALILTALGVAVAGLLTGLAVQVVVTRPLSGILTTVKRVQAGETTARVPVAADDELGVLARQFNDMLARITAFNDELQARVRQATAELEGRYQEVARLNEQLYALQRSLSQADRLALSGRIMAEVAHEVGTPLHSVAGHLELLRQDLAGGPVPERIERRLGVIESQVARVTEIIAQLLDLTRRSRGQPVRLDLNTLATETVDLIRPALARGGLRLELALEPALPAVRGHPAQLGQVILNLLTNAIDATAPGGRIAVSTRRGPETGDVELEVLDTGHGIPSEQHRQIFEPFFTTKPAGRGTGLGLFISAEIVRDHGGRLELASEPGRGSAFRLVLPAAGPA